MEKGRLSILKGEIDAQVKIIERIYKEIGIRKKDIEKDQERLESLSYHLHNLYCAFEDMFKIIADFFENTIEKKARYHQDLLYRMSISIEGIRPHFINEECYRLLDSLRSFRHFFRHAYAYRIDARKVKIVLEDALKLKELYKDSINEFINDLSRKPKK